MHRVLLHQADTCAIYCRPVSRGETRVAVLVRDQTNHESMCRDQDAELKGVARSGQYLDFRPKSLGCKQTASRHFSLEATTCGPEAGPGTGDRSKHHGQASLGTEPSHQCNRRAWSMSSRGVHKLHHDRCRWGLHSRATRLFPQPRPEKWPSGLQRLVGAGYRGAWVDCGEVVWVVFVSMTTTSKG